MLTQKVLNWQSHKPQINTILLCKIETRSRDCLLNCKRIHKKAFLKSSNYWLIRNVEDYSCMKFKSDIIIHMNVDNGRSKKWERKTTMQSLFKGKLLVFVNAKIWGSWGRLPSYSLTPPRTPRISGLKYQILKPSKSGGKKWSRIFNLKFY